MRFFRRHALSPDTPEMSSTVMKVLVEQIVKSIVDNPDEIVVNSIEDENTVILELRVAKEDISKVIGKRGRNITAIRTIMSATRAQKFKRYILEVLE